MVMSGFVLETASTGQARADQAADKVRQEVLTAKGQANGFAVLDSNSGLLVPKYLVRTAQTAPANPTGSGQWVDYIDSADGQHKTRSTAGVTKRMSFDLGSGTTFPNSGMSRGDVFFHSALGLHAYNGVTWRQMESALATNAAGRVALTSSYPTQMHDGYKMTEIDTGRHFYWSAAASRFVKYAGPVEVIVENGNLGASGIFGVGSEVNLTNSPFTMPVSSDMSGVFVTTQWNTSQNSILEIRVLITNTAGSSEDFIQVASWGAAQFGASISFNIPKSLAAGAAAVLIYARAAGGGNVQMVQAMLRVTA